jgi:hypothetical protein
MTTVSKEELLRVLRRTGNVSAAAALAEVLPDPVDIDRDGDLLLRHGISHDALLDEMGGSP